LLNRARYAPWDFLVLVAVVVGGLVAIELLPNPLSWIAAVITVGAVTALSVLQERRAERRRLDRAREAAPAAVEEWELGEPPCPPAR
jgi:hypothetical protein